MVGEDGTISCSSWFVLSTRKTASRAVQDGAVDVAVMVGRRSGDGAGAAAGAAGDRASMAVAVDVGEGRGVEVCGSQSDCVELPSCPLQLGRGLDHLEHLVRPFLAVRAYSWVHHRCNAHCVATDAQVPARHAHKSWCCIPAVDALGRALGGRFAARGRGRALRVNLEVFFEDDLPRSLVVAVWAPEVVQVGVCSDVVV
jgi:hypothetical protein